MFKRSRFAIRWPFGNKEFVELTKRSPLRDVDEESIEALKAQVPN